jgi:hypothetical protein
MTTEDLLDLNLDCLLPEQLEELLIPIADLALDEENPNPAATILYRYGRTKLNAMHMRLHGMIDRALRLEKECDRIYTQLPKDYRW